MKRVTSFAVAITAVTAPAAHLLADEQLFPTVVPDTRGRIELDTDRFQLGAPFSVIVDFKQAAPTTLQELASTVRAFLTNYPNKTDYWEVINRKLNHTLIEKYKLDELTTYLVIRPDEIYPIGRASFVETRKDGSTERFGFKLTSKTAPTLEIALDVPPGALSEQIPDYRYLQQEIERYTSLHALSEKQTQANLARWLLARFPAFHTVDLNYNGTLTHANKKEAAPYVPPLTKMDADCRVQRQPGKQLVFVPADLDDRANRPPLPDTQLVTPPSTRTYGNQPFIAECLYVASGQADGIVLPLKNKEWAEKNGLKVSKQWTVQLKVFRIGKTNTKPHLTFVQEDLKDLLTYPVPDAFESANVLKNGNSLILSAESWKSIQSSGAVAGITAEPVSISVPVFLAVKA